MEYAKLSCTDFVNALASDTPTPGGGGASALTGAIGVALGSMVGSLTLGRKKYASIEKEIQQLKNKCDIIKKDLISCIDADAEVFEPLSKAYALPDKTEEEKAYKARVMEECSVQACETPMRIMGKCCEALEAVDELAKKGNLLLISDAGCGAAILKAALMSASLNIFINTRNMKDRETAEKLNQKADFMLDKYGSLADAVFEEVKAGCQYTSA